MFHPPRAPRRLHHLVALLLVAALVGVACDRGSAEPVEDPLVVGAWPSVEPRLLAETIVALLDAEGVSAVVREFGDAGAARQALELGEADLLPGYTGAAWLEVLGRSDPPGDARTSFARVREFDERRELIWLRPRFADGGVDQPPADATFAFFVQGPPAVEATIATMSQLASRLSEDPDARLCMDEDFITRPDGRDAVYRAYGIALERRDFSAKPGTAVAAVRNRECLAGLATVTDGEAFRAGLVPLVDDLDVFPAFVVAVVARQSALSQAGVTGALGPFASQLTGELLARHNGSILQAGSAAAAVVASASELAATLRQRAGLSTTAETEPPN